MPPSLMFGQEMFSSIAATPSASERIFDTSTYSSSVVPQTFTMTVAFRARSSGNCSSTNRRTPMPFALGEEQPLDDDAAERREIDRVGVLDAVAEAAARRDERVLQVQRSDRDGEIHQSHTI